MSVSILPNLYLSVLPLARPIYPCQNSPRRVAAQQLQHKWIIWQRLRATRASRSVSHAAASQDHAQCWTESLCGGEWSSTIMNEWFWAFSSKLCVPEGISFAGSLQTWLICILIILSHFSYFQLIYNWFRGSWLLANYCKLGKMASWWSKISNFINLTLKWNFRNVPSLQCTIFSLSDWSRLYRSYWAWWLFTLNIGLSITSELEETEC